MERLSERSEISRQQESGRVDCHAECRMSIEARFFCAHQSTERRNEQTLHSRSKPLTRKYRLRTYRQASSGALPEISRHSLGDVH